MLDTKNSANPPINSELTLGFIGSSLKIDERRVPLHPEHSDRIPEELRRRISIEQGFGERFGYTDADLSAFGFHVKSRSEVIAQSDIVVLPKPQHDDLREMRDDQILWGWPHCVQDRTLTQLAIDKRLTLIAFEAMNHWASDGSMNLHVFHANNELAGYSSVLHALELNGLTGNYGRRLTATVIGFGATARGAVTALNAHGVNDVRVLTSREVAAVGSPIHSAEIVQFDNDGGPYQGVAITEDGRVPLAPFLAESDLVVNCTLQDPNNPAMYLHEDDLSLFKSGSLIIDVSCDEAMGFSWATPTSFAEPIVSLAGGITYYAVDHSPSYLWNSASWENSAAILPFLQVVMDGPGAWDDEPTIARAIEIRNGAIVNPAILEFQNREAIYPHEARAE